MQSHAPQHICLRENSTKRHSRRDQDQRLKEDLAASHSVCVFAYERTYVCGGMFQPSCQPPIIQMCVCMKA